MISFLQIIYNNFLSNRSSPISMHPRKRIVFWHRSNARLLYAESWQIDHVLSEWWRLFGVTWAMSWGRWVNWPNSPQWPTKLVQVILRDSAKEMIINPRWMVWLLLYHSSITDRHDFSCATDRVRTQCGEIIHGKGRENSESELQSLSSLPTCCGDGVCLKGV